MHPQGAKRHGRADVDNEVPAGPFGRRSRVGFERLAQRRGTRDGFGESPAPMGVRARIALAQ